MKKRLSVTLSPWWRLEHCWNVGKLFSKIKLVTDNLLFIYAAANWEATERSTTYWKPTLQVLHATTQQYSSHTHSIWCSACNTLHFIALQSQQRSQKLCISAVLAPHWHAPQHMLPSAVSSYPVWTQMFVFRRSVENKKVNSTMSHSRPPPIFLSYCKLSRALEQDWCV